MEAVGRSRALHICTALLILSEVHSELIHVPSSLLHGIKGKPLLLPVETHFRLDEAVVQGTWYQTRSPGYRTQLVTFINGTAIPNMSMKNRFSFHPPNASLLIYRLDESAEGEYHLDLNIQFPLKPHLTEERSVRVTVDVPVSVPVIVKTPSTPVVEDRGNVTWSCSVDNGTRVHYQWLRDNVPVHASDRLRFSRDNSTLVISPVRKEDMGRYHCLAWNHVSLRRSHSLDLSVFYGPYNLTVHSGQGLRTGGVFTVNPGELVSFDCLADSNPPNSCEWISKGSNSTQMGPTLEVRFYRLAQAEEFLLRAFNNVTQKLDETQFTLVVASLGIGKEKHTQEGGSVSPLAMVVVVCSFIIIGCMLLVFLRRTCHPKRVLMNIYKRPLTEQKRPHRSGHEDATEDFGIYEFVSLPGKMESTLASSRSLARLESVQDLHTTIYDVIRHIPNGTPTQSLLK